jgi:hypothetical protein
MIQMGQLSLPASPTDHCTMEICLLVPMAPNPKFGRSCSELKNLGPLLWRSSTTCLSSNTEIQTKRYLYNQLIHKMCLDTTQMGFSASWPVCIQNSAARHGQDTDDDSVQDMPDPDKPETWTFQVGSSWLGQRDANLSNEERLKNVKIAASELSEPFRSANLWMPEDTIVNTDPIAYWVPIPFETHQGRITLCGDAAHPLPPRGFTKCEQMSRD